MDKLFVSYRGDERSRVREVEEGLYNNGLQFELVDDIDLGDLRGNEELDDRILELMRECIGMVLLIGDTNHSPKKYYWKEMEYAKSNRWNIFGIRLSNRTGGLGPIKRYKKFHYLDKGYRDIVNFIHKTM